MNENLAAALEARKCMLLMQETSHQELVDLNGDLPSDTHLVTGLCASGTFADAVRGYKMSDIFDVYHDFGHSVKSIKSGYGAIKPKLWTNAQPKETAQ